MLMPDELTLIAEDPEAHGVFEKPTLTERTVLVLVRSVGMTEKYQAMANGLNPSLVFILRDAEDYQDEKIVRYRGRSMRVIRTYITGRSIELTCEQITVDAAITEEQPEEQDDDS